MKITDNDINYAENILFGRMNVFDDERKSFIKNLETIDLQAVPGSGKTTALLAKLLILEKYLPFDNGSGILVLSHTNAAIDEIKNRIGKYCPKLFSYPNFVGTIQSFVDTFLAIPFYVNEFKTKPYRIDDEIYYEKSSIIYNFLGSGTKKYLERKKGPNNTAIEFFANIRIDIDKNLLRELNGPIFLQNSSPSISYEDILEKKERLLKDWGVLSYDDAYLLASQYLIKYPNIKNFLQKRFKYVFVDEMQDMDVHQYELLEKIFYDNGESESVYQRIGDKNQAIYSNKVKLDDIWQQRNIQYIKGSYRLSPQIARLVEKLALTPNDINGLNNITIKPHIIVFGNETIEQVIPKFAELIKKYQEEGKIPRQPKHKFMAIGWRKTPREDNKLTVSSYWKNYQVSGGKNRIDFQVLRDYLNFIEKGNNSLAPIRKNILNAFLKITRLENIYDENERNYTKRKLLSYLKENNKEAYEKFKLNIYQWSISLVKGKTDEVYQLIKNFIPEFLGYFYKKIKKSNDFINGGSNTTIQEINAANKSKTFNPNTLILDDIEIEIGSVHSAKGQTHTATLYLETYYQGKYESEYLTDAILANDFSPDKTYQKRATKMAYVGFSRPTHLLCIAIHKNRYEKNLAGKINNKVWEILNVGENNHA